VGVVCAPAVAVSTNMATVSTNMATVTAHAARLTLLRPIDPTSLCCDSSTDARIPPGDARES
jgi:hypothetical protein